MTLPPCPFFRKCTSVYPFIINNEKGAGRKEEIVKNTKLGDAHEQKTKLSENNKSKEYKDKKETEMKNTYVHYM
jgi:hypothetical protein